MVLNWGQFCFLPHPRGSLAVSQDIFGCHNSESATGIYWVEARDVAKVHGIAPTTKSYPAQYQQRWSIILRTLVYCARKKNASSISLASLH